MNPDGKIKNEIGFIMLVNKQIFNKVSVFSTIETGNYNRTRPKILSIKFALKRGPN